MAVPKPVGRAATRHSLAGSAALPLDHMGRHLAYRTASLGDRSESRPATPSLTYSRTHAGSERDLSSTSVQRFTARIYEAAASRLPSRMSGRMDYWNPSLSRAWLGPMNGQRERRLMVRELFEAVPVDVIVETGTYRGTTTEFLALVGGVPVRSVESNPRYARYSQLRLAGFPDVEVEQGDSRSFLKRLGQEIPSEETVFFYLDAHWYEDLPLRDEVQIIAATWSSAIVLVDDFQVADDPGYGYDDYGPGKSLDESLLPWTDLKGWVVRYPTAQSVRETGARRGSVVLLSPAVQTNVGELKRLRPPPSGTPAQ